MSTARRFRIAFLLAALALCLPAGNGARAGDDDDLAEDPLARPEMVEQMVVIRNLDANIDNWLFGNRRFSNPSQKLSLMLKVKADGVARAAGLSESQKEKLMLAGEGDIRRFLDRVEEIKLKHKTSEMPQGAWNRIFLEIQPLRQILVRNELFGDDSLFAKTARKTLAAEQAARYEKNESERLLFQHRTRIAATVARLSDYLGLRDDQRKRLTRVMLEQTQPQPLLEQTERDQMVGLALLSRLPEQEIKPIFDADQWRELQRLFDRVQQVVPMLRQQGAVLKGRTGIGLEKQRAFFDEHKAIEMQRRGGAPLRQPAAEKGDRS